MGSHIEMSAREKQILRAILRYKDYPNTLEQVAHSLHITEQSVKNSLHRLRRRYDLAAGFVVEYRKWRRQMPITKEGRKYL